MLYRTYQPEIGQILPTVICFPKLVSALKLKPSEPQGALPFILPTYIQLFRWQHDSHTEILSSANTAEHTIPSPSSGDGKSPAAVSKAMCNQLQNHLRKPHQPQPLHQKIPGHRLALVITIPELPTHSNERLRTFSRSLNLAFC